MAATLPASAATAAQGELTQKAGVAVQAIAAMLLGALVIGTAGFSRIEAVHNAAHDTRHANGFPCH
jgi:cobalt transporter subunit CbtB